MKFPAVADAVESLPLTFAIIDGEIVLVDAQGRSSFQKLQRAMGKSVAAGFVFQVFDLIYLDGYDLTQTPLKKRKSGIVNLKRISRILRPLVGDCAFLNTTNGGHFPGSSLKLTIPIGRVLS